MLDVIQIILTVVDVLALVLILWFTLFGFIRGWKKSILNTIAFLLPFIIIMANLSTISNGILNLNFFGKGSLQDLIVSGVESIATKQGGFSHEAVIIVDGFVLSLLKWIIYGLAFSVAWIISLFIKLVFKLTLKKFIYSPDGEKRSPRMKERLIGLGVGFARGFIMIFLLFGPLMGLVNLTDMVIQDIPIMQKLTDTDDGAQYMSEQSHIFDEIHDGINSSVLYNVLNIGKGSESGIGVTGRFYGWLFSVEIKESNYSLIKEYGYIRQIFPVIDKIIETNGDNQDILTLSKLSDHDIELLCETIENSNFIEVASPILLDLTCNLLENEDPKGYAEVIKVLRSIDIQKEIRIYAQFLNTMLKNFNKVEIDLDHLEDLMLEECFSENAKEIFEILLQSELFTEIGIPTISKSLTEEFKEEEELAELFSEESIKSFIRTDIETLLKVYQNLSKNNNLHNFIFSHEEFEYTSDKAISTLEDSLVKILNLSIISGREDLLIRLLLSNVTMEALQYDVLFKDMNVNWKNETSTLAAIICEVLQLQNKTSSIEGELLDKYLQKDEDGQYIIKDLLNEIAKSELLRNAMVNIIYVFEDDEEYGELIRLFNFEVLKTSSSNEVADEFMRLLTVVDLLNQMNFIGEGEFEFESESIREVITLIFESIIIVGKEDGLVEYLLDKADYDFLQYDVIFKDMDINWQNESQTLATIICEVIELQEKTESLDGELIDKYLQKDEQDKYLIKDLLDEVAKSDLFKNVIVNIIHEFEDDEEYGETLSLFNFDVIKTGTTNEVIEEFDRLLSLIDLVREMNIIGEGEFIFEVESVKELINLLFDSMLIEGNESEIIDYIVNTTGLNEMLNEYDISLNYENVNWETEPSKLVSVFEAITAFGNFEDFDFNVFFDEEIRENQEKIITLLEALDNSQIFSPSLEKLINTLLSQTEYEISITPEEFAQIRINTWDKEISNLVDVIEYCRNTIDTLDESSIQGSDVSTIMIQASDTVIATKILGTALNELFGNDGLKLNPITSEGVYKYDFRDAQILRDVAGDIGSLIDIKNATTDFDISDITDSDQKIDIIIDNIQNLGSSDIVNDMVNEYLGEDVEVDLSGVDTEKEAEIIGDIYDVYKEDPDNFDLDEHQELKEKVEESEVVDAILKLLGITKGNN